MPQKLISRSWLNAWVLAVLVLCMVGTIVSVAAQAVIEGFTANEPLQRGMIVTNVKDDNTKIEAVTTESIDRIKGVVVEPNDSPVTLSSGGDQTYVATTGNFVALVSDETGPIKTGDFITISSLHGIGMKATEKQPFVLGRAVGEFDGSGSTILGSTTAGDKKINFGRIEVNIAISKNPIERETDETGLLQVLRQISATITSKPVSPFKLYLAAGIFLIAAIISGTMLYSGIRNSLISIGRNPLSKKAILRGMIQVIVMALIIFLTGLFAVYLLLKL